MNVFGSSQSGEIKKINSNLEQSNKLYSDKLNKIEHLIEENHSSITRRTNRKVGINVYRHNRTYDKS
ncbi:Uncharacterized protein FWK35_00029323 [Aphis craccivora]|uniref:Uncharacterized protein n=1 Tax=Aphis craccivora TaxID=307492 RepID=A0A6G0VV64_APHCR|nr:Uncharacterized protein FWK35_00029323 [Aphis craccivora]